MSEEIKAKKDLHVFRKLWHMAPGVSLVLFIKAQLIPMYLTIIALGLIFIASAVVELLRLNYRQFNKLTIRLSRHIIRREELKQISGVPYYLGACFLVTLIFNKDIASLSILYLAIGDPIASFFGIKYGGDGYKFKNGKSLVGTLAALSFCMCLTMIYGSLMNWNMGSVYLISLLGGIGASLAETFVPDDINDNLFIPVVSAIILSILFANYPVY